MPESITKHLAISAFGDFAAIDVHGALESIVTSMPTFDGATCLEEVQTFFKTLSNGIARIKASQEKLNRVFRQYQFAWFRAHLRATSIHPERVGAAFGRLKEAIESNTPDRTAAEVSALLALKGEAARLDRETKELMWAHNVSEDELNRGRPLTTDAE